jgi:hypothetical protein
MTRALHLIWGKDQGRFSKQIQMRYEGLVGYICVCVCVLVYAQVASENPPIILIQSLLTSLPVVLIFIFQKNKFYFDGEI